MGKERRKFSRYNLEFNGSLYLCDGQDGPRKSDSIKCQVVDLSRQGAGIITSQIIIDNQHFFFAALDSDDTILHLEINVSEDNTNSDTITYAVRPVWFDRVMDQEPKPFKMGVEFFDKISNGDIGRIKKQAA